MFVSQKAGFRAFLFHPKSHLLCLHWDGVSFLTVACLSEEKGKPVLVGFRQYDLSILKQENNLTVVVKLKIKQYLQQFQQEFKLEKVHKLLWIVPEKNVILRRFSLPKLPQKELHSAVLLNVKKNLPYRLGDIVYSYKLILFGDEKIEIIFYGMLKEYVKEIVPSEYLDKTSFIPQDLAIILLAKELGYLPGELFALLYDKDNLSTGVILGDTYGSFIFRDVSQKGNLSAEVDLFAEYYKRQNRTVDLSSLKRVYFRFFTNQKPYDCEIVELEEIFSKLNLSKKEEMLSPIGILLSIGALLVDKLERALIVSYKEDLKTPKTSGSLIGLQRVWELWLAKLRLDLLIGGLLLLLVLAGIRFLFVYQKLNSAQRHYQKVQKSLPLSAFEKNKGIPSKEEIERKKQELDRQLNYYRQLLANRRKLYPILLELTKIIPDGFWLKLPFSLSQNVESGEIQLLLNGGVYFNDPEKEMASVDKFLNLIKEKLGTHFKNIELLFSRRETDLNTGLEYLSFSISCKN